MARSNTIQVIRTTRAALNTQASAGNLRVGEPYFITDENRFAIGTSTTTYQTYTKDGEAASQASVDAKANLSGATFTGPIAAPNHLTNMGAPYNGKPLASEKVVIGIALVAFSVSAANSQAKALTAATASTVFTIKKLGSATVIGTVTFAANTTLGTFSITSGAIAANDMLYVEAPATPDATLSDPVILVRA